METDNSLAILVQQPIGVLSTVDPDRGVHAVPVVFVVDGEQVLIPVDRVKAKRTTVLRRVANLERDPRATLLVDHRAEDWSELWWVRADLLMASHDVVDGVVEVLAAKYPQYREPGSVASVLRFDIVNIAGWSAHG